jgi:hypothetical protein
MTITVKRIYHGEQGTNGDLYMDGVLKCHTIELPWLNNEPQHSCIPEGTYKLEKFFSGHLGPCLHVKNVPGREAILIHSANDAIKELRGCIAPVTYLERPGVGSKSKIMLMDILQATFPLLDKGEDVLLTIQKA